MTGRSIVWTVLVVGCLDGYGFASPSYSATFTREQRALDAPTPTVVPSPSSHPLDGDPREGRHLILETLSALAALKFGKKLALSSSSSSSSTNSLQNWFSNPFNVTLSLGHANKTTGPPIYTQTPIYNTFPNGDFNYPGLTNTNYPGVASASAAATLYRGEACNANAWPTCSSGVTPCNNNDLPACYFDWPSCNSNGFPYCNAVLEGITCNNNTLPYCVDAGVPCNSNDLNFCINAPSPCNDNNWPYCPGFGTLAASFNGVVNGVVNGGVGGTTGPNGVFFGPTGTALGNGGVNGAFFSPSSKVATIGQPGSAGATFVKNNILTQASNAQGTDGKPELVVKPSFENLSSGLHDLLAQTNSTPPWTFELTSKPLSANAVHKYVVAIAPMVMPPLGVEAVSALDAVAPPEQSYDYMNDEVADLGGESMLGDDFDLLLFSENRVKPERDPRKPGGVRRKNKTNVGVTKRQNWKAAKKPLSGKHSKHASGSSGNVTSPVPGTFVGLPEKFHELAKISKLTFGAPAPEQRSLSGA